MPLNEGDSVCCKDRLLYSKSSDASVSDSSHPKNTFTKAAGVVPVQSLDTVTESDNEVCRHSATKDQSLCLTLNAMSLASAMRHSQHPSHRILVLFLLLLFFTVPKSLFPNFSIDGMVFFFLLLCILAYG